MPMGGEDSNAMDVTPIRFGDIAGVLTTPAAEEDSPPAQVPLVLMIHGSGPLDRDENTTGQELNIFNAFAADLARSGIASFRYDKRGCGESAGDFKLADQTDFTNDAIACLDGLAERFPDRFKKRFLLGHSEGTLIAARLCQQRAVEGLVLICPYITDMETILTQQAAHLDDVVAKATGWAGRVQRFATRLIGKPSHWQARLIRKLKTTNTPTIRFLGRSMPAAWLRECLTLDPRAIYAGVEVPALVIGGEKDVQCDPADAPAIAEVLGALAETHILDDMTHILRLEAGEPSMAGYPEQMKQPVIPSIMELTAPWIAARAEGEAD